MFTDNYLEMVKKRVYQGKGNEKLSAQYTLYKSLLTILKLISPIMPFITEEIYQEHFRKFEKDKSIHISAWPKSKNLDMKDYDKIFGILNDRLTRIRTAKTKARKSMNSEIILTLSKEDHKKLKDVLEDLKSVTNAKEIKEGKFKVEFTGEDKK
jgi:valyl-tRNA synthetase